MASDLRLDWCSHEAADFAVRHWHYSRSLPPPPHNRVGVWEGGTFIGCVLFARGASASLLKPYNLRATEGCELVRVALTTHAAPVSRIVRIAIKLLRQRSPGMRLIVSFADPAEGHVGGIYQAMGWLYAGVTARTVEYLGPDGKVWHNRMVSKSGRKKVYGLERPVLRVDQCQRLVQPPKHRYLLPLDAATAAAIESLRRPYPKHAGAASVQPGGTQTPSGGRFDSDPPAPSSAASNAPVLGAGAGFNPPTGERRAQHERVATEGKRLAPRPRRHDARA